MKTISIVCMFLIFSTISFGQNDKESTQSVYDRGIEILKYEGVEAGVAYFEKQALDSGNLWSLFGMAWGYWKKGNAADAVQICNYLLFLEKEPTLEGHCHFLKGYIYLSSGDSLLALDHLKTAAKIYVTLKRPEDQFKAVLGLAAAHLIEKQVDEASEQLKKALEINEESEQNLGYFFYLRSRAFFLDAQYEKALQQVRLAYQAYKDINDVRGQTNCMMDKSLYLFLNGDFESGLKVAYETQDLIEEKNYIKFSYYNAINFIWAYRCVDLPYKEFEEGVRGYIKKVDDSELESLLDFALNSECITGPLQ